VEETVSRKPEHHDHGKTTAVPNDQSADSWWWRSRLSWLTHVTGATTTVDTVRVCWTDYGKQHIREKHGLSSKAVEAAIQKALGSCFLQQRPGEPARLIFMLRRRHGRHGWSLKIVCNFKHLHTVLALTPVTAYRVLG
jgi:hypothetical protein